MLKALLDTDILSEISKGHDKTVLKNAAEYLTYHPQLTFSSVSVYEVLFGLHSKEAEKQIQSFSRLIEAHEEILPGPENYRTAALIKAKLRRSGIIIGDADPIIASCAIKRGWPLITGNTRHYNYIQSAGFALELINWRKF